MTRFVKADTATQVNSNLIGVQVRPDTWRVVDSIDVDITNNFMQVYPCVAYDDKEGTYVPAKSGNMSAFLADTMTEGHYDGGYEIYFITGNSETDVNGDKYNECLRYPDAEVTLYMNANDVPTALQTHLYDLNWDESQQGYVAVARTNGASMFNTMFNIEGDFAQVDTFEYIDGNSNIVFKETNIEGVVGGNNGGEGFIVDEYSATRTYTFDRTDISTIREGVTYYYWDGKQEGFPTYNLIDSGVGTLITWNDINVGNQVIFNMIQPSYNPLFVRSLSEHQESDGVDCTVSYSVDGETWTAWTENLTDDNNVIANIPRYMYLRFSQDVVITEE